MSRAQEGLAGSRQRRIAGGSVLPAGSGSVDGGEPPWLVQVGGVPAVALPRVRVGDDLAVKGPVGLVVSQPIPELFPGLQQRVVGDLDAVLAEDQETLGAEDVYHRVDICRHRARARGAQVGPAAPAPRELAIGGDDGQLGEHQAGRVLLGAGQGVVGGLGAGVDRVSDAARTPVAAQGQLAALAVLPGGGHRLRHQRQHPATQPAPGILAQLRDHRLDHGRLHRQAGLSGRPGHREPQFGLAHRPDRERSGVQRRLQRRISDEPTQEIRAHRRDHQRRREFVRAGRDGGRCVQRRDEAFPIRPAGVRVPVGGEQLLELVDH